VNGDKKGRETKARSAPESEKQPQRPGFTIVEEPGSKDHRSFAANVFGTVAFKMLEWLTPAALEDMSKRTRAFSGEPESEATGAPPIEVESKMENGTNPSQPSPLPTSPALSCEPNGDLPNGRGPAGYGHIERETREAKDNQQPEHAPSPRTTKSRRNSNAKVRTSSGPKPKRQLSIDPYAQDNSTEEPYAAILRSPRAAGGSVDKGPRVPKTAGSSISRPISQLSSAGFFDDVALEKMPSPKTLDLKSKSSRAQ
jgi:hypothetical protein